MAHASASSSFVRRRDLARIGADDSSLRRANARGDFVRIAPGTYARTSDWAALDPMEQHRMRVLETADRMRTQPIFSHFAAAALWGIRILGHWPTLVDITIDRTSGGRSGGMVKRHCLGTDNLDVVELDGMLVTSPAQTAIDLARTLPFTEGVVLMDSALHRKRAPRLVSHDEMGNRLAAIEGRRGFRRALAAWEFSTDLSDSPEESHSRVQIELLGFPKPELQLAILLPSGRYAFPDFTWRTFKHAGELDGRAKYTDPAFLNGRTPQQAVIDEKNRENELRSVLPIVSRWEPRDLYPPRKLYDILTRDGLPSSKPRP